MTKIKIIFFITVLAFLFMPSAFAADSALPL
jgi:hypothetical protein